MQPQLKLLDDSLVERVIAKGFELLQDPGVKVYSEEGLTLLADAGAEVDFETKVARIPQPLVERALGTAPSGFALYDGEGNVAVRYEADHVHFDPGSSAVNFLDGQTGQHRQPVTADYVRYAQLIEMLPAYDAISTAFICSDVVEGIGDLYRLYLTLLYSSKPVVTGAFRIDTLHIMKDLLVAEAGGLEALAARPRAIFDACSSPPLVWSELTCQNLIDCARYGIPAQLISMPLAGSTAPVTLVGAVVQHTAESMSGVTIHQLAAPGAPIVWGGAPAITDMRFGSTPMGAIETAMIDVAYAQVGKRLAMPTHTYLGASDSKLVGRPGGLRVRYERADGGFGWHQHDQRRRHAGLFACPIAREVGGGRRNYRYGQASATWGRDSRRGAGSSPHPGSGASRPLPGPKTHPVMVCPGAVHPLRRGGPRLADCLARRWG